jgi:hypothetical protein
VGEGIPQLPPLQAPRGRLTSPDLCVHTKNQELLPAVTGNQSGQVDTTGLLGWFRRHLLLSRERCVAVLTSESGGSSRSPRATRRQWRWVPPVFGLWRAEQTHSQLYVKWVIRSKDQGIQPRWDGPSGHPPPLPTSCPDPCRGSKSKPQSTAKEAREHMGVRMNGHSAPSSWLWTCALLSALLWAPLPTLCLHHAPFYLPPYHRSFPSSDPTFFHLYPSSPIPLESPTTWDLVPQVLGSALGILAHRDPLACQEHPTRSYWPCSEVRPSRNIHQMVWDGNWNLGSGCDWQLTAHWCPRVWLQKHHWTSRAPRATRDARQCMVQHQCGGPLIILAQ